MTTVSRRGAAALATPFAAIALLAAAAPAAAQSYDDGYRRPIDGSLRYVPPSELAQWAGLYIGGTLGASSGSSDVSGVGLDDISTSGMTGGVMAGYNFQMGSIVAGVE